MDIHSKEELYLEFDVARIHFAEEEEEEEEACYVVSLKDITDRIRAETLLRESEEKFRRIFETANEGICIVDENEFITNVNQKFADMMGYAVNDLLNKNFESLLFKEDLEDHREKILDRREGKTGIYERRLRKSEGSFGKDGSLIWCIISASPIIDSNGSYIGSFALFTDITDRKQMEKDLITAKENAEEANRLKSGFLSAMSHEIRTPLNIIIGFNGVIRDIFGGLANEDQKLYFEAIENGSLRLLDTITRILDISRIEADEFNIDLKSLSINSAIASVYHQLKILAVKKKLGFNISLPENDIKVIADEYCLNGVLINIMNNAIKYSEKGTIEIKLWEEEDYAICSVKDEGIGMTGKYQKHLYQPFSQEDVGISRRYEGTGLGLALTKSYIERINGEISIESQKNVGTAVTIKIPLEK